MIKRICAIGFLLASLSACGGGVTSPSDTNVSGNWSGTTSSQFGNGSVSVTVAQAGTAVTGTWLTNDDSGSMKGTVGSGGSVQMTLTPSVPTYCPYNVTVTVDGNRMSGTYAAFNCTQPVSGTLSLTKR